MLFQPWPFDAANSMGYAHGWIKSGPAWSPTTAKRLRFWWRPPFSFKGDPNSTGIWEFGLYVRDPNVYQGPSAQGDHSYTEFTNSVFANQWVLVSVNWNPSHIVGGGPNTPVPVDPEWNAPAEGAPVHYFDGLTRFYFDSSATGTNGAGSTSASAMPRPWRRSSD